MPEIDIEPLRAKLGRSMVEDDVATEAPLRGMAATFERDEPPPKSGDPVPPGWHLAYFPDAAKRRDLAEDGLPTGRGVLPKMPLPRRMYAGATLTFHAPILVGDKLRRETEFSDVQVRRGSTGTLILVTQTRRIYTPRGLALTDAQHGVFREAVPAGAQSGIPRRDTPPADLPWRRVWAPNRAADPAGIAARTARARQGPDIPRRPWHTVGRSGCDAD